MYIVGIEPKASFLGVFDKFPLPREGLVQLLTMAKRMGHECIIFCESIAPIQWEKIKEADLVAISTITPTALRAYELNRKTKKVNPKATTVMGGSHVTFLWKEALDHGVDYVIRYEADESWPWFLRCWAGNRDPKALLEIPGFSFKVGNQYVSNPKPKLFENLDSLPITDFDLIYGYKPKALSFTTSRGCPWGDCDFCSVPPMFGRKFRCQSEDRVIEAIRYYRKKYGDIDIFFGDDNFAANPLRVKRLCQRIIKEGLVGSYSAQVRLDLAKHPDVLALMERADIGTVYIGYESTNPQTLEAIHKGLSYDDMERYTRIFHSFGIKIHSLWIIGFDTDTLKTLKDMVRASIRWRHETTQIAILVPFPGTPIYEQLKERIFTYYWPLFNGHWVVFYPKNMTPFQLQAEVILEAMPKLYNFWQTARIFVINNWRTATGFLRRDWHPIKEIKSNISTLLVRIWGKWQIRLAKKPVIRYLRKLAQMR